MKIAFVADVVCPWCAIGLAALEGAVQRVGLEPEWHIEPFELNPHLPPEGEDIVEHLGRKYGLGAEQVARNLEAIRARGAALGFRFGARERTWNTFDAHRLLYWAGSEGRALELERALLAAYHGDGENIADHGVLARVAARAGLDAVRAGEVLASGAGAEAVRERERLWLERGIQAVPAVVIDDRHLISGGQPVEVFERALRQLAGAAA